MYRLVLCLVFVIATLAAPRSAAADVIDLYDTVDSVEVIKRDSNSNPSLTVRGILAGGSAPITRTYAFLNLAFGQNDGVETALHCQRLAVLAMSKPGKFQFGVKAEFGFPSAGGCSLTLVSR